MFLVILLNLYVSWSTQAQIYTHIDKIPYRPYAVVLGTAKYSVNKGNKHFNQFYLNRLLAVEQLFNQKKVSFLLLSGDNRTFRYNEPRSMFQDLQKMGIPASAMRLDFAGFRTLDSVRMSRRAGGGEERWAEGLAGSTHTNQKGRMRRGKSNKEGE